MAELKRQLMFPGEQLLDQITKEQLVLARQTPLPSEGYVPLFVFYINNDASIEGKSEDNNYVAEFFPESELPWWHQIAALGIWDKYIWLKKENYWMASSDFRSLLYE